MIDDHEFTFNEIDGCHFVEFILPEEKAYKLSIKLKEGSWGIACAFIAY